jgi:hypothetical protein
MTADVVSLPDAPSYCAQLEETSEMVDGNVARLTQVSLQGGCSHE